MDKKERIELIEEARLMGLKSITIEGVVYEFGSGQRHSHDVPPDMEAKDLVKPLGVFDEMSEEEIQYWHTNRFDELQAVKERQKKAADEYGERE